jgi:hypothetical protein
VNIQELTCCSKKSNQTREGEHIKVDDLNLEVVWIEVLDPYYRGLYERKGSTGQEAVGIEPRFVEYKVSIQR